MWSRFCGGGGGLLRQKVSAIVNVSHGYGGRFHPFDPPLLGMSDFGVECGGIRKGGVTSLSVFMVSQFKRGVSSSPSTDGGDSNFNSSDENGGGGASNGVEESPISFSEAKKLMRLVNVKSLKMKLGMEGKEVISYSELLEACKSMGVANNSEEAAAFAKVLDDAGDILLFRDKVYLHPDKVVDLVRRAVPLALTAENDPIKEELKKLQEKKEEIDVLGHKQVRRILWSGLGGGIVRGGIVTVSLFFRLTFWELSCVVMEPIAFFATSTGLVIGYAYFLFTWRDPTYQLDFMKRLFLSWQRKLHKRYDLDVERFKELQCKCKTHTFRCQNHFEKSHRGGTGSG